MSGIDTQSATWRAVTKHIKDQIEELHREMETQGLDPRKTDFIRGQINALRGIEALPSAGHLPDIDTPAHYT